MSDAALSPRGRKLAGIGEGLAWATLFSGLGLIAWFASSSDRFARYVPQVLSGVAMEGMPVVIDDRAWLWGLIVLLPGLLFFVAMPILVARLFAMIRKGDLFGERVEQALRHLSYAVFGAAFCAIIQRSLLALVLSWDNAPGKRITQLTIGTHDLFNLITAIFFLIFAQIIREARRADTENKGFV
jgi:hypothetical protein